MSEPPREPFFCALVPVLSLPVIIDKKIRRDMLVSRCLLLSRFFPVDRSVTE